MKIKFIKPNTEGRFEFTEEELQSLVDEAYQEGFSAGSKTTITTPTAPYLTYPTGVREPQEFKWEPTCISTGDAPKAYYTYTTATNDR